MIPRRWSLVDALLVPLALFLLWRGYGRHRRSSAHSVPRERLEVVRAHGRRKGDWRQTRRAGWMVPTLAALTVGAAGCWEVQPALSVSVTGQAPGNRATLVYTVDGQTDSAIVDLPYHRRYRARLVVVQATAADGRLSCLIEHGDAPVATDADDRPNVAACSASVLEADR